MIPRTLAPLVSLFLIVAAQVVSAQVYTGTYDWTDGSQTATRGWTLYVPESVNDTNLKAIVLWSNGSGEDRRYMAQTPWVQAFARAHQCAIIGFELDVVESGSASSTQQNLSNALTGAATASGRASLVNAPLLPIGMSFGGINSSSIAGQIPARVLGYAANKGVYPPSWINGFDSSASGAALVPGIWMPGENDSNSTANALQQQTHFLDWRGLQSNSGRVGFALDYNSGHSSDSGQSWDLATVYLSEIWRLRHPGTQLSTTAGTYPSLTTIPFNNGWLAERVVVTAAATSSAPATLSNRPTFPQIAAVASYSGTPAANSTSWLPSELTARAYQAFTSTDAADVDKKESPLNNWLQIETPARYQQFRVGETPTVTVDTRRWSGVTSLTYRHFRNGSLVTSETNSNLSWTLGALAAGFHVVIVEATDGTNQRAAFVTFTAEDGTGVPANAWTGGAGDRQAEKTANWTDGLPGTTNRRLTTFNADTAQNTDYATNGDFRVTNGSMTADPYYYGLYFPSAASTRGWQLLGWRAVLIGPGGILNEDAQTVTLDHQDGRLRLLTSQSWTASGGDITIAQNGTFQVNLATSEGRNAFLTLNAGASRTITVNPPVVGNGGIVKTGAGLAVLAGANTFKDAIYYWDPTYQETIRVHEGTLRLGSGASLADTNRVFVAAAPSGATFDVNGNNLTVAALTGGGTVALGTGGRLTLQHKYEESVTNTWTATDWRGAITGGTNDQDTLTLVGAVTNVDSDGGGTTASGAPSGTATMRLGGTGTYEGRTLLNSGVLQINSSGALGATGSGNETVVASGTNAELYGTGLNVPEDFTFNTGNSATTITNASGSGSNTLSGTLRFPTVESAATNLDALLLNEAANTTLTLSGTLAGKDWTDTGTGKTRLFLRGASGTTFDVTGVVANGSNGSLSLFTQKQGSSPTNATFRFSNANTYTGSLTHLGGTLVIAGNAPSGSAGALGNSTGWVGVGASWGTTSAEDVAVVTEGAVTVGRTLSISTANSSANTTIGGSTAHASTFSGDVRVQGSRNVRLTAASGGTVTFSGTLREETSSTQTASFTKVGAGTVVLSRATGNTYVGGTTVSEGTLLANNTSGSATGTGAVTVASGGSLGGTGIISGAVTVQAGGALAFTVSTAAGSHDKLELSSTLDLSASESLTITVPAGGTPGTGTYTLLTASGGITGAINTLNLPSGWTGSVAVNGNNLELTVTAVPAVPAAPGSVTATAASQTQINLTWSDVATETAYVVQRSLTSGSGYSDIATLSAGTTSYSDTGLTAGTTYYYRVLATNNGGPSTAASASATTLATPPTAPSGLGATAFDFANIDLSWTDNASNETGFKVERSTTSGSGFAEVGTVGANVTTYRDSGRSALTTYYYRVRATNSGGDSSYTAEASATTPSDQVPATPASISVYIVSDTQNLVTWTDSATDETGYKIERKAGAESFVEVGTSGANTTSYSDTGLTPGTSYTYRVRAANGVGDSPYSSEATPAVPVWTLDGNGNWSGTANWSGGFMPNAVGAQATLGTAITAGRTLTLDADATLGTLTFNEDTVGANAYVVGFNASRVLTFDVTSGTATLNARGSGGYALGTQGQGQIALAKTLAISAGSAQSATSEGGTVCLSSQVTGAGGLVLSSLNSNDGTGTAVTGARGTVLRSTVANTFSGGVTVNSGYLMLAGNVGNLGSGTLTLNASDSTNGGVGTVLNLRAGGGTISNPIVFGNAAATGGSSPRLQITLSDSSAKAYTFSGTITGDIGSQTLRIQTFSSGGTNTGSSLTLTGGGGLTVGTGALVLLRTGTLTLGHANALGTGNSMGDGSSGGWSLGNSTSGATGTTQLLTEGYNVGGRITTQSATSSSNTNSDDLVVGGTHTTGTATFSGNITIGRIVGGTRKFQFTSAAGGTTVFSGVVADGSTSGSASTVVPVSKIGAGIVSLTGANTYTGGTTVSAGTLLANNTSGSGTGTGAVSVASGAALGGTGTVSGAVTVADGGKLAFTVSTAPGSHDKLDLSGSLTLSGASTVVITATGTGATPGTYTLLTAAGGISGTLPTLTLPTGWAATLEQSGNNLNLVVTATSALESWRITNFGSWENTGTGADAADPDGDGLVNLLEYALGTNPNTRTATSVMAVSATEVSGSKYVTLDYKRSDTPPADVTYTVESCSGMSGWATGAGAVVEVSTTSNGDGTVTVRVRDAVATASGTPRFVRLRVTTP